MSKRQYARFEPTQAQQIILNLLTRHANAILAGCLIQGKLEAMIFVCENVSNSEAGETVKTMIPALKKAIADFEKAKSIAFSIGE